MEAPTKVPTACARFKNDITHTLDWALRGKYRNMIQSTWYSDGGHFAAMEVPKLLYKDLVNFVNKLEL